MNLDPKEKLQNMRKAGKVAAEALDLAEKLSSNRNLRLIASVEIVFIELIKFIN